MNQRIPTRSPAQNATADLGLMVLGMVILGLTVPVVADAAALDPFKVAFLAVMVLPPMVTLLVVQARRGRTSGVVSVHESKRGR
jgi:hypothetical protein